MEHLSVKLTSTKSLGVYIDQNLSWNVHVHNLCKKIAAGIGVKKRSRDFVSFDTLQNMSSSSQLFSSATLWLL